jgi:hypothetical protein
MRTGNGLPRFSFSGIPVSQRAEGLSEKWNQSPFPLLKKRGNAKHGGIFAAYARKILPSPPLQKEGRRLFRQSLSKLFSL